MVYSNIFIFKCKKGVSSIQLSKYLSITQKSAWFMLQRIREVMKDGGDAFGGINKIDEAYLGGRERNKHANKKGLKQKTTGIGVVTEIRKKYKAFTVIDNKAEHLLPKMDMIN